MKNSIDGRLQRSLDKVGIDARRTAGIQLARLSIHIHGSAHLIRILLVVQPVIWIKTCVLAAGMPTAGQPEGPKWHSYHVAADPAEYAFRCWF